MRTEVRYRGWYKNGQLWYEYTYKNGKKDGLARWWHENGQLEAEGTYKDGKLEGARRMWDDNGEFWYESS